MARTSEGRMKRDRWRRGDRAAYAASRKRPLSSASRALSAAREPVLGPYETRYDVRVGYEVDRDLTRR